MNQTPIVERWQMLNDSPASISDHLQRNVSEFMRVNNFQPSWHTPLQSVQPLAVKPAPPLLSQIEHRPDLLRDNWPKDREQILRDNWPRSRDEHFRDAIRAAIEAERPCDLSTKEGMAEVMGLIRKYREPLACLPGPACCAIGK